MNRILIACVLAGACAGCGRGSGESATGAPARPALVHAAGLVEPTGEERVLIPEVSGRLKRVYVSEGDAVQRGQVLAEIENADATAQVSALTAQLAQREAELLRLRNGARPEERTAAEAEARGAAAEARLATGELERRRMMFEKRQIPRETLDQAQARLAAAQAAEAGASATLELIRKGARAEDLAAGTAARDAAQAELERAQALLEKTRIRAPVDGVVLKREMREGETVVALSPIPFARVGDLSRRNVRADVDELDLARIRVGQPAEITADAYPGKLYKGTVTYVASRMGRRSASTDSPAEKKDAKVLEVLIELEPEAVLPIGLRVDVRIGGKG